MRTISRRAARTLLAAVATGALIGLTACSAGGGTPTGTATNAPTLPAATANFLKKEGKALGTKSINVLAQSSPQAIAIQDISSQFTQLTGIKVNWTVLDEESTENKASVALGSSGGGYDVIQTPSNLLPTYQGRDWIDSISRLASRASLHVPGWNLNAYGTGLDNQLSVDGQVYGVPMFVGTQVYYYRTDLFKKAGITTTPKTYAQLIADVKKVNTPQVAGIALRSSPDISQLLFDWSAWLYAYGGSYYTSFQNGKYTGSALDSPAAVKALTDYADLLQHDAPSGATNWTVDDVTRAFAAGQVAIAQEGAVFGGTFNNPATSQVAGKVGTFVMPAGPAGTFVPYQDHGWSIAKNSTATDAAWLFTQWATLKQTLIAATQDKKAGFSTPPLASVYTSAAYRKAYGFDDFVPTVTKTLTIADNGGVSPLKGDPNSQPSDASWGTVGMEISQELSKAVTGQESPKQAIAKAAKLLK